MTLTCWFWHKISVDGYQAYMWAKHLFSTSPTTLIDLLLCLAKLGEVNWSNIIRQWLNYQLDDNDTICQSWEEILLHAHQAYMWAKHLFSTILATVIDLLVCLARPDEVNWSNTIRQWLNYWLDCLDTMFWFWWKSQWMDIKLICEQDTSFQLV